MQVESMHPFIANFFDAARDEGLFEVFSDEECRAVEKSVQQFFTTYLLEVGTLDHDPGPEDPPGLIERLLGSLMLFINIESFRRALDEQRGYGTSSLWLEVLIYRAFTQYLKGHMDRVTKLN